jgi:hypothetical protein
LMRFESGVFSFESSMADRYLLWIDQAGCWLLLAGEEFRIGSPEQQPRASALTVKTDTSHGETYSAQGHGQDIAILADISRHHATIQKLDEHWLIHPHRNVVVNGKTLTNTATVHSDDELCLNGRVRLKFRIPNAVAGTALLEFMSVHRTPWNVNGIILMSDFCLIGSKTDHHIVCTEWSSPVILYRQNHEVCVRSEMPLEIDHQKCTNGSAVSGGQIVSGTDLRFRLERIS